MVIIVCKFVFKRLFNCINICINDILVAHDYALLKIMIKILLIVA